MSKKDEKERLDDNTEKVIDDIVVEDVKKVAPKIFPLIVKLPESASSAQVAFAKILNAFAYQSPEKWEVEKDVLISQLRSLQGKELKPNTDSRLEIGGNSPQFVFLPDGKGGWNWVQ